jgi:hypothetical protein
MPVKDYEALVNIVTQLRLNPPYQAAEALRRRSGAAAMATASQGSAELAAILLMIGTWERIAIMAKPLNRTQLHTFFRSTPVSLMWEALKPAIDAVGGTAAFAPEFERLNKSYNSWLNSSAGRDFRSADRQAVTGLFA